MVQIKTSFLRCTIDSQWSCITVSGHPCLNLSTGVTGNRIVQTFFNGNGQVGQITLNGSTTSYQTSSDYRLKENVEYDFDATSRVKELPNLVDIVF